LRAAKIFRKSGDIDGVSLQMLGLREGELHVFDERLREIAAAERNGALPDDFVAVGDDEVGIVGADIEGDDAIAALLFLFVAGLSRVFAERIEREVIDEGERRHLNDVDFDVDVFELLKGPVHHVFFHGE